MAAIAHLHKERDALKHKKTTFLTIDTAASTLPSAICITKKETGAG